MNTYFQDLINNEVMRITKKYNKDFLNCSDLMKIMGLCRKNVTEMMKSPDFPLLRYGNRMVVSVFSFVVWQFEKEKKNGKEKK